MWAFTLSCRYHLLQLLGGFNQPGVSCDGGQFVEDLEIRRSLPQVWKTHQVAVLVLVGIYSVLNFVEERGNKGVRSKRESDRKALVLSVKDT